MTNEPTLQRIWDARQEICAQCDNDPVELVAYYVERQKQNSQRLLKTIGDVGESRTESENEQAPSDNVKVAVSDSSRWRCFDFFDSDSLVRWNALQANKNEHMHIGPSKRMCD